MQKCKYCGNEVVTAIGQIRTKNIEHHRACLKKYKKEQKALISNK